MTTRLCSFVACGFFLAGSAGSARAADYYVATNATPASPYNTWGAAFTNVQDALDVAVSGDAIYLAGHTFGITNALSWTGLAVSVSVRGGYAATNSAEQPGPADAARWPTIIRRTAGNGRVWSITGATNGLLSGVTITGGTNVPASGDSYGGGLYVAGSPGLLIASCTIVSNRIDTGGWHAKGHGGGIYCGGGGITISNCVFARNRAYGYGDWASDAGRGGGLAIGATGGVLVRDCVFWGNEVDNRATSPLSGEGGAVYCSGTGMLRNCLLFGNKSFLYGDGVFVAGGVLRLENSTVAHHGDDGIYRSAGAVSVSNSIVWDNGDDLVGSVLLGYSDIEDGDSNGVNGCISADPRFEYGYYLSAGSPCADTGSASSAAAGLDAYTTATNGAADSAAVDLGYHYAQGPYFGYADLYVAPAPTGSDSNAGTDPALPLATVRRALSVARDGTRIRLAAGAYTNGAETFPLAMEGKVGVQIVGTNRDLTVLNAAGSNKRVLTLFAAPMTRIEGLTVRGGKATEYTRTSGYGGGLYVDTCGGSVLASCLVVSNRVEPTLWHSLGYGGGLSCPYGSLLVSNCQFSYNQAAGYGDFATDLGRGGAIHAGGFVTVCDSVISANDADCNSKRVGEGGGLYATGTVLAKNSLFYGNRAYTSGDALFGAGGTLRVESCTVANHGDDGICRSAGTVVVSNSILWANGDDITGSVALAYCDIEDGDSNGVNGCLSADPLFEYGYYLSAASPCVDTGSMSAASAGLASYTTRADGSPDAGALDLGYHAYAGADLGYADLYVEPAPAGSDLNVGTNPALPLATVTRALSAARDGTRIHLAAGAYTNGAETFPLTIAGKGGVQVLGTNREATIINAARSVQRVFMLSNAPNTRIEGVSIVGGLVSNTAAHVYGGGLFVENSGGSVLASCIVSNNRAEAFSPANHYYGQGGGVYCASASLWLTNCLFAFNRAVSRGDFATDPGRGGAVYAAGSVTMDQCVFFQNSATNGSNPYGEGGAVYGSGTVLMRNCLLHRNLARSAGDGVYVGGGSTRLENCTVANHPRDGIWRTNGTAVVTNSIVWNNGNDIMGLVSLGHSDIEDGDNNGTNGCISVDPQFADTTWFHLLSRAGYYAGGYFDGGSWSTNSALTNNLCLDAGGSAAPWSREPQPNMRRVNMGAYGNTATASKSFLEEPAVFSDLAVHAYPLAAEDMGSDWAVLNGEVLATGGGANPQSYICWGPSDEGTGSTADWLFVESMGARAPWDLFSLTVTNLEQIGFAFRCYVTNDVGADWSDAVRFGIQGPAVTNTGASQVRRRSAVLNGAILEVGGSTPSAWFHYWKTGETVTNVVAMGAQTGSFSALLSPLPVGTAFDYRVLASNSAGRAWSDVQSFSTWSDPTGWYVATNGSGAGGTNWATAFTNIQAALDEAAPGDTVYLAAHRFAVPRQLELAGRADVAVRGGYAGSGEPGELSADATVIAREPGPLAYRIWSLSGVTNSILERLTITGASNGLDTALVYGGGMYVTNCSNVVIASCAIVSNRVESFTWHGFSYGGGLCCMAGSSVLLTNCVVAWNRSFGCGDFGVGYSPGDNGYGGGISALGSVTLADCVLHHNEGDTSTANRDAGRGGAVYVSGALSMWNCLLYQNKVAATVGWGDAVYVQGGAATIRNCTISGHSDDGICRAGGTVSVSDSILWGNGDDVTGAVTLVSCDVEDGDVGAGCLSADPRFEYGYYLAAASPCVDTGSMSAAAAGLDGRTTRADGQADAGTVDLGYHYAAGADLGYADLYVAPAPVGSDANAGTNPALPLATVTTAIGLARDGTRIHLAAGTYTNGAETFPLAIRDLTGVQLLGTNRNATVLNAMGRQRVLSLVRAPYTRIEGVCLTGGRIVTNASASYGGGVYAEDSSGVVLESCLITSNRVETTGTTVHYLGAGGGVYNANGALTLSRCVIASNTAICGGDQPGDTGRGGGVYAAGEVTLLDCTLFRNEADNSWQHIGQGGGLYAAGTLLMRNCLVYTNKAYSQGDAIYVASGAAQLQNCTVAGHPRDGLWRTNGTVAVTNSILWGNGDDIVGTVDLGYCDIEDGDSNGVNGCISSDPVFANPAAGDYRLGRGSPVVDRGLTLAWMAGAKDLYDNDRVQGASADIGAFEAPPINRGTVFFVR